MVIIEILSVLLQGFIGGIKAIVVSIPSILELKDSLEIFTPSGMLNECIKYLGVPTFAITIISFVVMLVRKYQI